MKLKNIINRKILLLFGLGVMILLGFQIILADNGVLDLKKKYAERRSLIRRNDCIQQENTRLYRQVRRLRDDMDYIETIARRELGMIREDEVIFKFDDH